jgi:hypothetical protein
LKAGLLNPEDERITFLRGVEKSFSRPRSNITEYLNLRLQKHSRILKMPQPDILFYVLLTAHLGIILVNDQLDAQFFFLICLFQSSTCFEQPRAHHQENQLYQYNFWYMSLCVSGRLVCRSGRSSSACRPPTGHILGALYHKLYRTVYCS